VVAPAGALGPLLLPGVTPPATAAALPRSDRKLHAPFATHRIEVLDGRRAHEGRRTVITVRHAGPKHVARPNRTEADVLARDRRGDVLPTRLGTAAVERETQGRDRRRR